jgi:hypothetical protein
MSRVSVRPVAGWVIVAALVLAIAGYYKGRQTPIGDTGAGVPELRTDSRYNADTRLITGRFAIGSDVLNVIAETKAQGCVDHDVMQSIDDFAWAMQNVEGVKSVMSLPTVAKIVSAGWNEGFLKWRSLPRDERALVQAQGRIDTSTGLLNRDCSVMPVALFLAGGVQIGGAGDSETLGEGRQVNTTSTFEASSAGEAAQVAPSLMWRSASLGSRS